MFLGFSYVRRKGNLKYNQANLANINDIAIIY